MVAGVDALVVLLAIANRVHGYQAACTAIAGSLVGNMILFLIAQKGGHRYLDRYTYSGRGARLRAWFVEYGMLTVFVPAFIPVPLPLKVFVISAGALGGRTLRFALILLAARIPRYFFLAWLGTRLGKDTIPYMQHHAFQLLGISLTLFAFLYVAVRFLHRRKKHLFTDLG